MNCCNLRCRFCMVADEIKNNQPIHFEKYKSLISEQTSDTQIVFFGGEPTIHPYFLKLLRFLKRSDDSLSAMSDSARIPPAIKFAHLVFWKPALA